MVWTKGAYNDRSGKGRESVEKVTEKKVTGGKFYYREPRDRTGEKRETP